MENSTRMENRMIWCVEDDDSIRDIEIYTLKSTGFEAMGFVDGDSFWKELISTDRLPELVLMDIMLPGEDGIALLKKMRELSKTEDIPVIMATAKGMEFDKVQSLDIGADDYLVKPFGMMEMVSRIKAVLRRCSPKKKEHIYSNGSINMNIDAHIVSVKDNKIELTYKEYEILKLFLSNQGIVFTRDQLLSEIWGVDYFGETRTVDMHIKTLRQKLGESGKCIKTVRNVGYRMENGV